ncbi:MAG: calcium/sodium antiporter [Clostridia bacterium]|nr:calcium/sodium antiporter [Clostridia bacterium]
MIQYVLLFILGLLCLIKGGDWFVDGASGIAKRFKISEILIGATVVSIGTTLPEVMVSATGAIEGHGDIAYGNALGSIICNTALISALTMAIRPSAVDKRGFSIATAFFFGAAAIYAVFAVTLKDFPRYLGIILLAIFAVYMTILIVQAKRHPEIEPLKAPEDDNANNDGQAKPEKERKLWLEILLLVIGAALIAVGAKLLVDNGTELARIMGVSEAVIALTFVALGTSLPELVTAVTALIKGHSALSIGNIIGANLFNIVLVMGVAVTLSPFSLPDSSMLFGINSSLLIDVPLMIAVMLIMAIPPLITGKLKRWQGITLLVLYAAFITFKFVY